MNKKDTMTEVSLAWAELSNTLDNIKMIPLARNYFDENRAEEKGHRQWCAGRKDFGLTVDDTARLFCVTQLAEFLTRSRKVPHARDYLSFRHSLYTAAALVANYRKEIRKAFKAAGVDPRNAAKFDYAELVKAA